MLRELSVKLLSDLKEARERLNQGPQTRSRPPSSREPWQESQAAEDRAEDASEHEEPAAETPQGKAEQAQRATQAQHTPVAANGRRRAGKQPGAAGRGRTQGLEAQETVAHYATHCAGCGKGLEDQEGAVAYTACQEIDLKWGDSAQPGLHLHVIKPLYYEQTCPCGHGTRAEAHRG